MTYERDPLSWRYDGYVRQVMGRAIRASRNNGGVRVYIASPRGEFRHLDGGGRTRHERAFMRSSYYLMWRAPINAKQIPEFSLKMTWGDQLRPSDQGRMARAVTIRLFPRAQGGKKARRMPASEQWAKNDVLRSGGIGSPWRRSDLSSGPRGEEVRTTSYRQQLARERQRGG